MTSENEHIQIDKPSSILERAYDIFVIGVIVVSCIGFLYYWGHYEPRTWGDEGYLEVEISLDKTTVTENESFTVTITVENNWTSMLRVIPLNMISPGSRIRVIDENGTHMTWNGPIADRPLPENSDLVVLQEGESLQRSYQYDASYFNLEVGQTYTIQGTYSAPNYSQIDLPYWQEPIFSENATLTIV